MLRVQFVGFLNGFVKCAFLVFTGRLHHGRYFLTPFGYRLRECAHGIEMIMSVAIKAGFSDQNLEKPRWAGLAFPVDGHHTSLDDVTA